jgi:hypothetical protein
VHLASSTLHLAPTDNSRESLGSREAKHQRIDSKSIHDLNTYLTHRALGPSAPAFQFWLRHWHRSSGLNDARLIRTPGWEARHTVIEIRAFATRVWQGASYSPWTPPRSHQRMEAKVISLVDSHISPLQRILAVLENWCAFLGLRQHVRRLIQAVCRIEIKRAQYVTSHVPYPYPFHSLTRTSSLQSHAWASLSRFDATPSNTLFTAFEGFIDNNTDSKV